MSTTTPAGISSPTKHGGHGPPYAALDGAAGSDTVGRAPPAGFSSRPKHGGHGPPYAALDGAAGSNTGRAPPAGFSSRPKHGGHGPPYASRYAIGPALAGACLVLAAFAAAASDVVAPEELGDFSIEQLMDLRVDDVVTASRYRQKVTQAPASVTIVTADEIRKSGYRTLADILRSMRGLYVTNDRNYSYLGSRGFLRPGDFNGRVLLLLDGHRLNENVYDGAYVGRESMINVDLIDRVEFIRGPGSAVYGSNALFSVINVITRTGADLDGTEATVEGGSFDTYLEGLSYGQRFENGVDLALSVSNYSSAGQRRLYYPEFDQRTSSDPRAAHDGVAENLDGEDAINFYARARYAGWTLSGFASSRDKEVPTGSYGTAFGATGFVATDRRVYLDLKYEQALSPELQLLARTSWDRYTFYSLYPVDYAAPGDPPDVVLNIDDALGQWVTTELHLIRRVADRHTLLGGIEFRNNLNQDQYNYDSSARATPYLDAPHDNRILGVFAQGEFALTERLSLSTGLRYDYFFSDAGGGLHPRVALIFNPRPATTLKALYGSAYRAPNVYEQFYYPAQATLSTLEPEEIQTFELVAEHYLAAGHRLNISAYRYVVSDLITQTTTPDDAPVFDNLDEAVGQGVELEALAKFDGGLELRGSYALQKTENGKTGQELSTSPRHLGKLKLIVPLWGDRLFGAAELDYQGSMRTLAGADVNPALLAHLNVFGRNVLIEGLDVTITVRNVFDADYAYPGSEDHAQALIPQDGRSLGLKLTFRF